MAKKKTSSPKAKKTTTAKKTTRGKKATKSKKPTTAKSPAKSKSKKDKIPEDEFDDEEDGPEFIEEDLDELDDEMLADDSDVKPRSDDEILNMLRDVECADCEGSSSRDRCKVRDQYGCPPDKADL
ncbi:MAG: hypothetical protein K9W44_09925 [Candidatus Lokiarchaeota archaeon]|nr:hypothetical protein [Candidatus Harpocratesius repetitus]